MARSELVATYLADLPAGNETQAAEAFAVGQSIGTWTRVPGLSERMRRAHGARVVDVRAASDVVAGEAGVNAWCLRVAFPLANIGPDLAMLFTTLLGNDPSTSIAARLVDLDLPASFVEAFPRPAFGIAGWRSLTGVSDRPLLLNMIKPCTGFPPAVGAEFVRLVAAGAPDLVKDDELLASPAFCEVGARARAYVAALDAVSQSTGQRPRYIANVTAGPRALQANAWRAIECGADALMINLLAVGLDAFAALVELRPGVPIFAHTAGIETFAGGPRSGFGHALLVGRLARLVGADAVLLSTPLAPRPLSRQAFHATLQALREPWAGSLLSMPVLGGGLTAAHVPDLIDLAGLDTIIGVGGAIQGHPDGAAVGARVVREAIVAAAERRCGPR